MVCTYTLCNIFIKFVKSSYAVFIEKIMIVYIFGQVFYAVAQFDRHDNGAFDFFEYPERVDKHEKEQIEAALQKARGNKTVAAKMLQIDRKTLYNKMHLYGIEL